MEFGELHKIDAPLLVCLSVVSDLPILFGYEVDLHWERIDRRCLKVSTNPYYWWLIKLHCLCANSPLLLWDIASHQFESAIQLEVDSVSLLYPCGH